MAETSTGISAQELASQLPDLTALGDQIIAAAGVHQPFGVLLHRESNTGEANPLMTDSPYEVPDSRTAEPENMGTGTPLPDYRSFTDLN
jgi:hypothetical protein